MCSFSFREYIAWSTVVSSHAVVSSSENAITTDFDYFRLGLAQLWRTGVIAWGVGIMRLDVARERSGNDRKH